MFGSHCHGIAGTVRHGVEEVVGIGIGWARGGGMWRSILAVVADGNLAIGSGCGGGGEFGDRFWL